MLTRILAFTSLLVAVAYLFVGQRFWTARDQHRALLAGRRTTTTINMVPLRELEWLTLLVVIAVVAIAILLVRSSRARWAAIAAAAGLTLSLVGFQETPARFFASPTATSDVAAGGIVRYPHRYGVGALIFWIAATFMVLAALALAIERKRRDRVSP